MPKIDTSQICIARITKICGGLCPILSISTNQKEIGRIQGKQIASLLPTGGSVLYIQGPSVSSVAAERFEGLRGTLPSSAHLVKLKGKWTEESAYQSVSSWMKLMGTQKCLIDLITAQNDVMAVGARKALKDCANESDREILAKIPVTGCDGVPSTGQAWVRAGHMILGGRSNRRQTYQTSRSKRTLNRSKR